MKKIKIISGILIGFMILFSCSNNDDSNNNNENGTNYEIGDSGPAGGIIFYDKGTSSNGWRYLEVATQDQSTGIQWGCYNQAIANASKTELGEGDINTESIIQQCNTELIAARLCYDLTLGNKGDWYLPTIDELKLLYDNLQTQGLGNFASVKYWSSSQSVCPNNPGCEDHDAWQKDFATGEQYNTFSKYNEYRVRAIRKF